MTVMKIAFQRYTPGRRTPTRWGRVTYIFAHPLLRHESIVHCLIRPKQLPPTRRSHSSPQALPYSLCDLKGSPKKLKVL